MARRKPDAEGTSVELLNVPHYQQGTFDNLCAYYAGAMMLASLFPKYAVRFGTARSLNDQTFSTMSSDPLISQYYQPAQRNDLRALATWWHYGADVKDVVHILNRIVRNDKEIRENNCFEHLRKQRVDTTFAFIQGEIDKHLPVLLGWNTKDYGCHAVLVVGYWRGGEKWLTIRDPGGPTEVNWNSLKSQQAGMFHVGLYRNGHSGVRPMKSITADSNDMPVVHEWRPEKEG